MISPDREPVPALEIDDDGDAMGLRVVDARHAGQPFARIRLVDVDLMRCDLSGCDFSESVWHRVTLVDCRASGVDLSQTNLRDVTFTGCRLDEANLRIARLQRVRFDDSQLAEAEFSGGALDEVSFGGSDLTRADFSNAKCASVDLRTACLDGIRGIAALKGATIGFDQLVGLAPALAVALGLTIGE